MRFYLAFLGVVTMASSTQAVASTPLQSDAALQLARAEAKAGRTEFAIQRYRALLEQEPQNIDALSDLAYLLEAKAKWPEAVPLLERLVKLQPHDTQALYHLGRMKSWQPEGRGQALDYLGRACGESDHNAEYCSAYADVLGWSQETRAKAIAALEATLTAHPDSVASRVRLAQMLSWNEVTRPQALQLFDEGLKIDPGNIELLVTSAEVLAWNRTTRSEALARYELALQKSPEEPRALLGKAQLLAWQNHSNEALELYRKILARDPQNAAALRGEAEILNWKGHFVEARTLAQQAEAKEPSDERARLELARADIGLKKFSEARDAIAGLSDPAIAGINDARQEIRRGLGSYVEFGYAHRLENSLPFDRFNVAVSTPLGAANRITFTYQPTLYDPQQQQAFNTSYFGTSLDSEISDRLTTHVAAGAEVFQNAPVNVDGSLRMRYKLLPSTTFKLALDRQAVEESLLSLRGENTTGLFTGAMFLGQVRSNLADLGISYENAAHHFDFGVDYTDGIYTGRNLDPNRRWTIETQLGKSLRSDRPFIRLGYYGNFTRFAHDADTQSGQPFSRLTGGYFSPTRFLLNQGVLNLSHRFSKTVEWGATGAAGVQNVETSTSSFTNTQFASSFESHLFWRATPMNEFRFTYEYLNVFNAFQRNLFRFAWRHYL
ncbi:MAG TPA: tetratricopeptide repeat protein [Candidatus Angelobacter sp.]|jgi:tetratricopeptide (TPR) repeat protein|nr:tetratricopeptide repeat protein [Candidatus Angelobacter sp.]